MRLEVATSIGCSLKPHSEVSPDFISQHWRKNLAFSPQLGDKNLDFFFNHGCKIKSRSGLGMRLLGLKYSYLVSS